MTNEEILANAPGWATMVCMERFWQKLTANSWRSIRLDLTYESLRIMPSANSGGIRSLSDIRRIVELKKEVERLNADSLAFGAIAALNDDLKQKLEAVERERIAGLGKQVRASNEIMGECWAMVGNDIDYEHGGYSTLHEHVNALKELATAAARDLNKLEDENAILITRLAALSIKFGEELPRTSEVLKEFATDQKIDELERFVQAFSKAALAAPVPEINRRANELTRAAIVGALKTATQDRINLLRQQQNEEI